MARAVFGCFGCGQSGGGGCPEWNAVCVDIVFPRRQGRLLAGWRRNFSVCEIGLGNFYAGLASVEWERNLRRAGILLGGLRCFLGHVAFGV